MMMRKRYQDRFVRLHFILFLLTGIWFALSAGWVYSEDLPAFRRGMWEFHRTIAGADSQGKSQTITNKKCTNPTEDMKRENEMLSKAGCKFSPITKSGNTYSFTSDCTIRGMSSQGKTAMSVENDSAYTINMETRHGKQVTKETLKARRTGECP